jgi:hypothetical protein
MSSDLAAGNRVFYIAAQPIPEELPLAVHLSEPILGFSAKP